ncbi:hypothetical protein JCM14076_09820 [Methylosoma difficile]
MKKPIKLAFYLFLTCSLPITAHAESFAFGLWGDMPYDKNHDGGKNGAKMQRLMVSMNTAQLAFTVFDGDSKDGATPCSDNAIGLEAAALFNKTQAPTVYVLGDNEWTDCHRHNNGGYNNLERLAYLRRTLFNDADSFGQNKLKLEHQGKAGGLYAENSRWIYGDIVFVGLNIPGSNNNKVAMPDCINTKSHRNKADCQADNIEYLARDAANIAYLREAFSLAKQRHAPGLVLIVHADLGFDLPETDDINERNDKGFDGFSDFVNVLTKETRTFNGQVLLVHGDTHFFKIDKPLVNQPQLLANLTRVETFGSPNLHWVKVTVDDNNANVFVIEPVIVPGN